jgi:hypothetical protein
VNPEQTKAKLIEKGKPLYEFTTKRVDDTVAIYADEFVIEGLRSFKITVIEFYVLQFIIIQQTRMLEFMSSLFLIYGTKSPTMEFLSKDKKFVQSVKKMKQHFNKVYGVFRQE